MPQRWYFYNRLGQLQQDVVRQTVNSQSTPATPSFWQLFTQLEFYLYQRVIFILDQVPQMKATAGSSDLARQLRQLLQHKYPYSELVKQMAGLRYD